ncbi:hypothetical protein Ancab_018930 [Ancistrocladus abbreviatus]
MEPLRIRVVFGDSDILSKSQKSDGLKRSWLLLKPHHETISDVVSHLLHSFDLHDSCSGGLLLSMDGFVLPPFELTAILKDKDIIRVKRKGPKFSATVNAIDSARASKEEHIVDKQPLVLVANEELEKEIVGYQSEPESDEDEEQPDALHVASTPKTNTISKKRKASKKLLSSMRKRQHQVLSEGVEKSAKKKHSGSYQHDGTPQKRKSSDSGSKQDQMHSPRDAGKSKGNQPEPNYKSFSEENQEGTGAVSGDGTKKVSRSALRKRAKRQWRREMLKAEKEKEELFKRLPLEDMNIDSGARKGSNLNSELQKGHPPKKDLATDSRSRKDLNVNITEHQDQDSDAEGDIFPLVIRPGHIRFAPYGKEKDVQQIQEAKDSYQWKGITSKSEGQKWGKDRQSMPEWKESRNRNWKYSFGRTTQRQKPPKGLLDFEKLVPLTDLPKQGDTIAYRLLELSSLFCPELSSFQVGKILWFKPESNRIMLVPVPEYPFHLEEKTNEDAFGLAPDSSHYKEDGSLEIDFQSLVDVRIVKRGDLCPSEAGHNMVEKPPAANSELDSSGAIGDLCPSEAGHNMVEKPPAANSEPDSSGAICNKVASSAIQPSSDNAEVHAPTPDKDVWEEMSEALNAKKEQLQQEDNWSKKETPNKRPWSYRTLRSNTLGPTVALLRQQNGV